MEKVNSIVGEKNDVFDPRIILELNKCIKEITSSDRQVQYSVDIEDKVLENQINSSFPITFYHNAYVDHRYSLPRLRIFSLNKCIKKKNFLLVDLSYEGISDPIRVKLFGESLEGNCPSTYGPARPCFYVAHTFYTDLISTGGMNEVLIHLGSRKVKLRVKEIDRRYEKGITMCVQPVYYYSQWQNIVLYIEAWRAQGATRFIVFYHSSTKETRKVLDYYQSLGIIEYRSWPSFGSLPQSISGEYPKVDDSVFIFSYFLAMNLCILDMKTTIGAVADFDEVLVPRNGTMLDYATKEMTGTNIGALSFGNNYVTMEPSIYTSDFSGVSSPAFIDKGGPSKYIFNASVIDIAQVHWVKSFTDPSKKTKNGDGALLHLRYGASGKKLENSKRSFRFFPNDSSIHIQNMQEMTNRIFNGSDPVFSSNYIDTLNECVKNINKKGNTCRSTGGMCRADMDAINEWVYDKTEGIFLSDSS
ncbi:hypothetical protein GCK72_019310 [Caenorhabditis remanei]|uniref:Glycosyltransferase family 92 protein n=1 Tax=Caenorhabditis remanei TaxID=31234 RepID=A0A6A5GDM0_CAERE|nr:hypothetical protein GCK72_019310 [Caenorhabditis remanei]KAF1752755.1 hypothetical protein GCK72_019310 [Caenorhabditis remanei]